MDYVPECCRKPVLLLGCGNILFGDDGFGPAVVEYLQENYKLPETVWVMNVGTSVREILFDLILSEVRPRQLIVIDALNMGKRPGELFEISVEDIPENKIADFSLHQFPTSNLLKELQELCRVKVTILTAQVESIPEEVRPGLSKPLTDSLPRACELILEKIKSSQSLSMETIESPERKPECTEQERKTI